MRGEMDALVAENNQKLVEMRLKIASVNEAAHNVRMELKVSQERGDRQIEALELENSNMSNKIKNLTQSNKFLEEEGRRLNAGYEAANEAKMMLEETYKEELLEAKKKFEMREETLSRKLNATETEVR